MTLKIVKMGIKRLLSLAVILIAVMTEIVAKSHEGGFTQLTDFPFVFVSEADVTTPPLLTDSLFDASSRGIRFQVNRTDIQQSDPFIPLYRDKLVPWLKMQEMELRQVFVRGAASPEGPYQNNVRLSRARTQSLIDFLNEALGDTKAQRPVDAQSVTEDYGLLVRMMGQAGDADYELVKTVWQECNGDEACCKQRLMSLKKGRVWQRLKRQYFPALRQARVILWFARKPDAKPRAKLQPTDRHYDFATLPPMGTINIPVQTQPQPVDSCRRHLIAARTNLLHDFLYVPQFGFAPGINIQLEYYPLRGHYTYNAAFTFTNHRHWEDYKFFQIRDAQLEVRRYFKGGGKFIGTYVGVYGEFTKYGIGFSRTKGWQGEGGGGGLSVGYTTKLNRKGSLRLELSASLGFFYTRHDPYVYGNPITGEVDGLYYYNYLGSTSDFMERNHKFTWLGPTNAGIHITYDIIYRKKKPCGYYEQKGGCR